jgi:FtsP/CotA-like multicopper oxidase with cupredoxin domain
MPGLAGLLLTAALVLASCAGSGSATQGQGGSETTSNTQEGMENTALASEEGKDAGQASVAPTVPETPSVETMMGAKSGNTRTYNLTASEFTQTIANFPLKTAKVWGYNESTPGPTLIAYEGETVQVNIDNELSDPTTIHFHGMHEPNEDDGVAGISQPDPIEPGQSYT